MPERPASSLLWQICSQSLWGKRGLLKSGTVWLPVALFLSMSDAAAADRWRFAIGYFLAQYLLGLSLNLANDLADRAEDLAAGKIRWIQSVRWPLGLWIVALTMAAGGVALALFGAPLRTVLVYLLALALGLGYSIRPVRFKERGLVGLTAYGFCGVVAHVAVPATWLEPGWRFVALFAVASFLFAWVKLHFHQVVDYEADSRGPTRTYAVRVGLGRARQTLHPAAWLATASILAVIAYLVSVVPRVENLAVALSLCVAMAAGGYAWLARSQRGAAQELPRELPFYYLGLTYGFWWALPPLLLIRFALQDFALAAPATLSVLTTIAGTLHFSRYRYE